MALVVKNPPDNERDIRDGINSWVGKIPWRRESYPLLYSCLENPMDRGVWWAVVHWVTKSWMQLTDTDTHVLGTGQCRREWNPFLEFRMEGKGTNPTTVRL